MKHTLPLLLALLVVGLVPSSAHTTATTYYACDCQPGADGDCVAGDDSNPGTAPSAPLQTYDQTRQTFNNTLTGGDEIRFCRGGSFTMGAGTTRWLNTTCTASQSCLVADYTPPWATGDEARPVLTQPIDNYAFDLSNPGDAEATGGITFRNLDLRCLDCPAGGWAFFLFNDVNDIVIQNVRMEGFAIGIHLAGSNSCFAGDPDCNGQNDRITIENVTIINGPHLGILGSANDLLIENSYFENNGDGSIFDHNIYVTGGRDIIIRNNELYRSSLDGSGSCGGTSLVGHGFLVNLLIEGNWVYEDIGRANPQCWGISITNGYAEPESFTNVTIRNNRVENVGNVSIGVSSCETCLIENNVVVQQQGFGGRGIAVPDKVPGPGDAISADVMIRNNSVAMLTGTGIEVSNGTGHSVVSNALQVTTSDANWNCFNLPLGSSSYGAIDHNVCGFSVGEWVDGVGGLGSWQALGWGLSSQAALPGFVSNSDLHPTSEMAAMVQAGHPTLSSAFDYDGNARPVLPSAGAYEWLTTVFQLWLPVIR